MRRFIERSLGSDRRPRPDRLVAEVFRQRHPGEGFTARIVAEEEEQFVVAVFFGATRPQRIEVFQLSKRSGEVSLLEEDAPYRPRTRR